MKVLVTGAGALLGQGIIRSLRGSTLKPLIIAVDPSPLSPGLYWADSAHLIAMANRPDFGESIERVIRAERPDAVLVGTDVELSWFAIERERLEHEFGTKVVVSSHEVVQIADDKWLTAEFLRRNGFAYPKSVLPGDEESLISRVGFPLLVKPRVGARAVGVAVVRDREELAYRTRALRAPVIQEYLGSDDDEYTAGIVCFDGSAQASIVMRRDLRDGNTYRAYTEPFSELNAKVRQIAEALGAYGPVNLQFRLHKDQLVVFEINARFSGTTPLRALCGFNEVEMVLRHVLFGEPVRQPEVRNMTILRHWSETVVEPERIAALRD